MPACEKLRKIEHQLLQEIIFFFQILIKHWGVETGFSSIISKLVIKTKIA